MKYIKDIVFIICILFLIISYNKQKNNLQSIENNIKKLNEEVSLFKQKKSFIVEASAYTLSKSECNSDLKNTSTMSKPIVGWTVAVSQDLHHFLGKKIYIEGIGIRKITDSMNPRYRNRIDILMPTKKMARKFGVKRLKIVIID